jgi:hypothetical protein
MGHRAMPHSSSFRKVESIGRTLPGVEVTTTWGQPALKVHGKMFVCIASHKSAEPNTLVVMMDFADRDALVEDAPDTYYLKDHYLNYPCVLSSLKQSDGRGTSVNRSTALARKGSPNRAGPASVRMLSGRSPATSRMSRSFADAALADVRPDLGHQHRRHLLAAVQRRDVSASCASRSSRTSRNRRSSHQ